jgi:hypothetical protein
MSLMQAQSQTLLPRRDHRTRAAVLVALIHVATEPPVQACHWAGGRGSPQLASTESVRARVREEEVRARG